MTEFRWHIDEFLYFRGKLHVNGWAFYSRQTITSVGYHLPGATARPLPPDGYGVESPDVAAAFDNAPEAARCRFAYQIDVPDAQQAVQLSLTFGLADGRQMVAEHLSRPALTQQPCHQLTGRFFQMLHASDGGRVLEIGSRALR